MICIRQRREGLLKSCMGTEFSSSMIAFPTLTLVSGCSLITGLCNQNVWKCPYFRYVPFNYNFLIELYKYFASIAGLGTSGFYYPCLGFQYSLLYVMYFLFIHLLIQQISNKDPLYNILQNKTLFFSFLSVQEIPNIPYNC